MLTDVRHIGAIVRLNVRLVKVIQIVMLLPKLVIMAVLPQTPAVSAPLVSLVLTLVQPVPPHLLAQAVITLKPLVQHNVVTPATPVSKMTILAITEPIRLALTAARHIIVIVLLNARLVTLITAAIEQLLLTNVRRMLFANISQIADLKLNLGIVIRGIKKRAIPASLLLPSQILVIVLRKLPFRHMQAVLLTILVAHLNVQLGLVTAVM